MTTGWPAVRDTCARLGQYFDGWQDGIGRLVLGKGADGIYAALYNVISIPRQVGKTYLLGMIVFALAIIQPGLLVIWTAHRFKTARETFDSLRALAKKPLLAAHVEKVTTGAGSEAIYFRNGSRILFGSRERGFGRGFTNVGVLIFDEAQILGQNALDDMVPATNTAANPLIILTGTPPKPSDPGEAFTTLRNEALSDDNDGDVLYVEISADEGADPMDRSQWAKANPSYPKRTSARAILRMMKLLGPASFVREGLGIWDGTAVVGVFSNGAWARCATTEPAPDPEALGIAADVDQTWLSLGAYGGGHIGSVLRRRFDRDRAEFVAEVVRIASERQIPVAIDKKGPAAPLIDDLEDARIGIVAAGLDDLVQACADIRDAVETGAVQHGNYADLNDAVDAAAWRTVGDRRVFGRKAVDISMLEAVTLARWGASEAGVSVYDDDRGLLIL